MPLTYRPSPELDGKLTACAEVTRCSKQEVIDTAVSNYYNEIRSVAPVRAKRLMDELVTHHTLDEAEPHA